MAKLMLGDVIAFIQVLFAQRKCADPVTKSCIMQIYFIARKKFLASAAIEPGLPLETNHEVNALPLSFEQLPYILGVILSIHDKASSVH